MSFLKRHIGSVIMASEFSHILCCVLPTLVTVFGALANIGLISVAPNFILELHEIIHEHEISIIIFSAIMVAIGWAVHLYSMEIDCHNTGCSHPPCTPKKNKNARLLTIATILFIINLAIYIGVHLNIFEITAFNNEYDMHTEVHEHH